MKNKFQLIMNAAAVSLMAIPAVAQYDGYGSYMQTADSGRQGNYGKMQMDSTSGRHSRYNQMPMDSTTDSLRKPQLKNQVSRQKDQAGKNIKGLTTEGQSNKVSDVDITATDSLRKPQLKNQVSRQKDQAEMKSNGLTADDQSNKVSDVDITKRIRSEIVAHNDLSTAAQNVKIITVNGQVTLKGQVKNQDERRIISEIATRIVDANDVKDQLQTK